MTIDETIQYYLDKLPTEGGHVMVLSPDDSRHLQLVIWLTQLKNIKEEYKYTENELCRAQSARDEDERLAGYIEDEALSMLFDTMREAFNDDQ
jgi:hypothetical protein